MKFPTSQIIQCTKVGAMHVSYDVSVSRFYGISNNECTGLVAYSGPWTEILSEELENPLDDPFPLPLLTFSFPPTVARFIRFRIVSWYGIGGALQYFYPLFPFLGQLHTLMYIVHCITWCCSKANVCMW